MSAPLDTYSVSSSQASTVTPFSTDVASSVVSLDSSIATSPEPSDLGDDADLKLPFVSHKDRRGPNGYRFATQCATVDDPNHKDQYGSSSAPIYMSATFKGLPGAEFDYSRSGNPTRSMLQHHLCQLQNSKYSFAVSSGMACLDVITRIVKAGQRIIAGDDLYGGTNRLLGYLASHQNIHTDHVDTTDAAKVEHMLQQRSRDAAAGKCGKVSMLLLETPTNPCLKICDLQRCAAAAKKWAPDAVVVVDNTMMSPYLMRPLELGVDVVYDSGTKYLSGHHDLMAGVIACDRDDLGKQIAFTINSIGNALTPMDSFLLLRGIKTLAVRMDRQQASAITVAHYLDSLGFKVNYPGLASHPSKAVHDKQAAGPGSVLSFVTGDKALSERIVGATRLWGISVSFGCVNSLISMPCLMSHASIDPKVRAARGMPEDLIRLCVGIEDERDLLEDLENALLQAGAIRRKPSARSNHLPSTNQSSRAASPDLVAYERTPLHPNQELEGDKVEALVGDMNRAKLETRGGEGEPGSAQQHPPPTSVVVSAPGKVILFGEHAVVHGVTAIAGSVNLRCYTSVSPREDGKISLDLPDLGVIHTWNISELPWAAVPKSIQGGSSVPGLLDKDFVSAIEKVVGNTVNESERSHAASIAFLILFMCIAGQTDAKAQAFVVRSALPIGAGLGSSAAFSSCLSAALNILYARIPALDGEVNEEGAAYVNQWAFLSEKVIHGTPSGVDNSVAVHGGAISFTRAHPINGLTANKMEKLKGFSSFRFLLVDSCVGREGKKLIAHVAAQKESDPTRVNAALTRIQVVADTAKTLLSGASGLSRADQISQLGTLIKQNHAELVDLEVSHPSLELIKNKTETFSDKLATKLTGAGGGGCAVTLLPDDFEEENVKDLTRLLEEAGFKCYETRVGGDGFGVKIPRSEEEGVKVKTEIQEATVSKDFGAWVDGQQGWVYV
ncbi:related to cystathionine beta-lyase [Melanopsichium pennsylvanicum]|uniref:Cystathionine beta-lyase n=2 Tax=Melanopsichium pennsylvanicum TaxID=63383 RepID=A0AAJ5C795_9BASI|nr:related to cystathionine beta-lyase [Melanopsichium pennsylvanicum 4]SNX86686.1 related to cystathionine beta-lyase [Melanopsichium pennsylvanicum]